MTVDKDIFTDVDVFRYYTDKIHSVYSYLVALKGKKPLQALVEIENCFTHLALAAQGNDADTNIRLARRHLVRLHLDLYKLLLVEIKDISEKESKPIWPAFINAAKDARFKEINNVGQNNPELVIVAYKKAVNIGLNELGLDPL